MNFAVKYHLLATPIFALRWREEEGMLVVLFRGGSATDLTNELCRFLVELQLTASVTLSGGIRAQAGTPLDGPDFL